MQIRSFESLVKLPESHTTDTLTILIAARYELSTYLIKQRDQHETIRLQGQLELLDKMIEKLDKH